MNGLGATTISWAAVAAGVRVHDSAAWRNWERLRWRWMQDIESMIKEAIPDAE